MGRKVIACAFKTIGDPYYRCNFSANRELIVLVRAVESFRCYLIGRHFIMVTDHASLAWHRNCNESDSMVA